MRALNEEVAHVTATTAADAEFDVFTTTAFPLAGVESEVGNELLKDAQSAAPRQ